MTVRAILSGNTGHEAKTLVIASILEDSGKMDSLMACFFDTDLRICQKAAWPVGDIGEKHPELLLPYMSKMIRQLQHPVHDAVVRNTVRTWQFMQIPEEFQGVVFDICLSFILQPKTAIAIRAFSMTVCANICKAVPELKEELIIAIEASLENASTGILNRAGKLLATLKSSH